MLQHLRTAEKLTILKDVGHGMLERIHLAKKIFEGNRKPSLTTDPQYAKVVQALTNKFPDFISNLEKTQGYDLLTGKAKAIMEEIESIYFTIVDAYEFKEAALPVLNEVASGTVEMKLDENPLLVTHFLDLFSIYVQVNLLLSTFDERKLVMATYYKLFYSIKLTNEPNYQRVSNYVVTFEAPIKAMQEEFKSLSASLGKTLVNLMPLYTKLRTVPMLRKEGAINITLKPEDMPKPIIDKFRFQMPYSHQLYVWIIYGFLLCPETLSLPGAMDLCQLVLRDGFVAPIYRNTTLLIHQDYQNLFDNYRTKNLNLTKNKKLVKEALHDAALKAPAIHRTRRIYVRQELNALMHLLKDKPGLIAPKFQLLLCALSLAKEEVFWYFRYLRTAPPKAAAKRLTEDEFRDNKISEIIFLVDQLVTLIRTHKRLIQQYHVEYLKGADHNKLSELMDNNFLTLVGTGPAQICRAILDEISQATVDYNFKVMRLNWFRAEAALSSVQSLVPIAKIKESAERFQLIVNHTKFVDDIEDLIDRCANLKGLYFWKDLVYDAFDRAIKDGPNQPLHSLAFVNLVAEWPTTVSMYNAEEKEEIGRECIALSEKLLNEITARIAVLLNEVAKQYIIFDAQLADVNAAYPLLIKRKDYKPSKDFVPPETPGAESDFKRRQQLDRLRLYERNAWQLCSVLNEVESMVIFDHKFTPREFLREKLAESLRKFLRSAAIIEIKDEKHVERIIQRPTVLERHINLYVSVLKLAENFVDIDVTELVRDVFLSEIWIPAVGKAGSLDWVVADDSEFKYETPTGVKFIGPVVNWYSEFVSKKLSIPGVCYSSSRLGFVSRTGLSFRAEFYSDLDELKALCRLIGPYGARLIDREVLKYVLSNATGIKDALAHNKQALEELAAGYHNENSCNEALKKIRDIDTLVTKSIAIGNALYFRDVLHEALRQTLEERAPFMLDAINTMFHQYKSNTYMIPELLPTDALANDAGIELGTADQALKRIMQKAFTSTDAPLIQLLPYLYAGSFTSTQWREAQFKPLIEAHSNNVHALARCINSMTVCLSSIVSVNRDEREILNLQRLFVEVSSVILLRMAKYANKPDKTTPVEFPSVIIFMDRFVHESSIVSRDVLENNLPYSLLRNHFKSIYTPRTTKKQEVSSVDIF